MTNGKKYPDAVARIKADAERAPDAMQKICSIGDSIEDMKPALERVLANLKKINKGKDDGRNS